MRFVLLGTSDFTLQLADALRAEHDVDLRALVCLPSGLLPLNSVSIRSYAEQHGIEYLEVSDINSADSIAALKGLEPDYILSSWPKIISPEVMAIPRYCVIGSHPTELPHNRGRHPLHWMIVQGILKSKLSFFKMDSGIDTGNVLEQVPFEINSTGDISSALNAMNSAVRPGIRSLCSKFRMNSEYAGTPGSAGAGNTWRKRTVHDLLIDPRMSADSIHRLIRSFASPYPGALLIVRDQALRVESFEAQPRADTEQLSRLEPGKALDIAETTLLIKCADEVVLLRTRAPIPNEIRTVQYIHPPSYYLARYPEQLGRFLQEN